MITKTKTTVETTEVSKFTIEKDEKGLWRLVVSFETKDQTEKIIDSFVFILESDQTADFLSSFPFEKLEYYANEKLGIGTIK